MHAIRSNETRACRLGGRNLENFVSNSEITCLPTGGSATVSSPSFQLVRDGRILPKTEGARNPQACLMPVGFFPLSARIPSAKLFDAWPWQSDANFDCPQREHSLCRHPGPCPDVSQ